MARLVSKLLSNPCNSRSNETADLEDYSEPLLSPVVVSLLLLHVPLLSIIYHLIITYSRQLRDAYQLIICASYIRTPEFFLQSPLGHRTVQGPHHRIWATQHVSYQQLSASELSEPTSPAAHVRCLQGMPP
ncbi:hypothetical protein EDB80DRAFT_679568 [Ilyonectria destructans]|nr:hypothetical protein EDB80DRAFT_679568 [Ilyonectria destructans]